MSHRGRCEMHDAWAAGDMDTVQAINERLMPLHDALFCESSPGPVKYAAELLGLCDSRPAAAGRNRRQQRKGGIGPALRRLAELTGGRRPMDRQAGAGGPRRQNRRARYDYAIEDMEAAVLTGTRLNPPPCPASINEAYAGPDNGKLKLFNANIPEYGQAAVSIMSQAAARIVGPSPRARPFVRPHPARGHDAGTARQHFNARGIAKLQLGCE